MSQDEDPAARVNKHSQESRNEQALLKAREEIRLFYLFLLSELGAELVAFAHCGGSIVRGHCGQILRLTRDARARSAHGACTCERRGDRIDAE